MPTNPDMCRGSGKEVEYMFTLTSALSKAVTGLLQSFDKLAPPGELFCLLLMPVNGCPKEPIIEDNCLHHTDVLYKATEVTSCHTVLCTQSNK